MEQVRETRTKYTKYEKTKAGFFALLALGGMALSACSNNKSSQSYNTNPPRSTTYNPNNKPTTTKSTTTTESTTTTQAPSNQNQIPKVDPKTLLNRGACNYLNADATNILTEISGNTSGNSGSNSIQCSLLPFGPGGPYSVEFMDNYVDTPTADIGFVLEDNINQNGARGLPDGTNIWNTTLKSAEQTPNQVQIINNYQDTGVDALVLTKLPVVMFEYGGYFIEISMFTSSSDFTNYSNDSNLVAPAVKDLISFINQNDQ